MLHRPARRVGFATGKQNGAVGVIFFLALNLGLGPSLATGRQMQASGSPQHELQRLEGPGRERTVSASLSAPTLTPPGPCRSSPCWGSTEDTAHHHSDSALRPAHCDLPLPSRETGNRKPFQIWAHDYRTWVHLRNGNDTYALRGLFCRRPGLSGSRGHAGKCSPTLAQGELMGRFLGCFQLTGRGRGVLSS